MAVLKRETDANRASLGFPEAVISAFNFLVEELSFRCVRKEVTFVRFESTVVFVNVYHGRISLELNVEIGELTIGEGLPEIPFTIEEILHLVIPKKAVSYRPYQVHTVDSINTFVSEIARLTKEYATPALIGDHKFFQRLSELRTERSDGHLKELHLSRTRSEVESAWHQKNYSRVIELYDSMLEDLTPSEGKRLGYAKKRLFS
jgi:hypothetical protein